MATRLLLFGATFVASLGLALYLTPIMRQGALRFGVLDAPDGRLKNHGASVPYLGGIAIYLAFLVTLALVFEFRVQLLGLLLGATIMVMMGLFDDLRVLPPRLKFVGQLLAAWVLIKSEISIQLVIIPEWLRIPLTVFWLVGITNAFNILDVSDGLTSGTATIAALALFVLAVVSGDTPIAVTALALAGATAGFLRYNQPAASIYLGDAGSLFLGFMLAALAMIGQYTRANPWGAVAPALVLFVPILETSLVSLSRLARGRSPFAGSPDHFAVRLKAAGWSANSVAWLSHGLSLVSAAAGIALVVASDPVPIALTVGATLAFVSLLALMWLRYPPPTAESE